MSRLTVNTNQLPSNLLLADNQNNINKGLVNGANISRYLVTAKTNTRTAQSKPEYTKTVTT
jgi:hypothetical protein